MKKDLQFIKEIQKEIILLGHIGALLNWDQQTYMPKKASKERAEQSAHLNLLVHEKLISNELFDSLNRLKNYNLSSDDKIMVNKLYKDVLKLRKLPKEFVTEMSKATSLGFDAWQKSREKKDFKIFQPYLEKIIKLKRQETKYLGFKNHPYDSLLDYYEEGMTAEELKKKFEKIKPKLLDLIHKIKDSKKYKTQNLVLMRKNFPREDQIELTKDVTKKMGLEETNFRIDLSEHPFTTKIGFNDVRITTNIRDKPLFAFESTIHEAGHALYELGCPEKHKFDVLGETPSLGIHESQSRFWENMIGKSKPFWKYYFKLFDKKFKLGNFEEWYFELNQINPSPIRIESDELHYCLHVILRFELELSLIDGSIEVKDLPKLWNKKMKEYIGIMPKNDVEGVLQDVHWSGGNIGYFPTYAIGTIYASQLYKRLKSKNKNLEKDISKGDFTKITKWLKVNIHQHGRKFLAEEIIKKATGEGLNIETYLDYLTKKYTSLYELN